MNSVLSKIEGLLKTTEYYFHEGTVYNFPIHTLNITIKFLPMHELQQNIPINNSQIIDSGPRNSLDNGIIDK